MVFDRITAVIKEQGQEYDRERSDYRSEQSAFHSLLQHGGASP
jgi:hypothetical protein